jgi:hypothetical protein
MKTLHVPLEDEDYNNLKLLKGKLTWKQFILQSIKKEDKTNE